VTRKHVLLAIGIPTAIVMALVLVDWLAGAVILGIHHLNPMHARLETFYSVWYWTHDDAKEVKHLKAAVVIALLLVILPPTMLLANLRNREAPLYGNARFANDAEIRAAGLYAEDGILVGRIGKRYLSFPGQQFVLLAAPTRAGKGVSIVIPNLLNYQGSAVVLDIKRENFDITAGWRAAMGQRVFLFNPFTDDRVTHRYNPLDAISDDPAMRIGDVLSIAVLIYPSGGAEPFWNDQARNLFMGLVLYLCESPKLPRTLGEVLRQGSGRGRPTAKHILRILSERSDGDGALSNACRDALARFVANSEATLAGIVATFNAPLGPWADPVVDAATAASDFSFSELRRTRMTIYLAIPPAFVARARVIIRLLFSQLVQLNTRELPSQNPELAVPCLLLMDEFSTLGKLDSLVLASPYLAGYGLRILPVIQSVAQLEAIYGHTVARTFITNHALQILFAPREQHDANEYSEMLGDRTYASSVKSVNTPRGWSDGRSSESVRKSDVRRPLMLAQELKELGAAREIILAENCPPILADKIVYYQDHKFLRRLRPPPVIEPLEIAIDLERTIGVYTNPAETYGARKLNADLAEAGLVDPISPNC